MKRGLVDIEGAQNWVSKKQRTVKASKRRTPTDAVSWHLVSFQTKPCDLGTGH